jgi:hypothetical protein
MSEPERPFLPMSWELGGDFMNGMADSIRERGAREVPAPTEEGVDKGETTIEEAWERVWEWEDEEDEWDEWEEEEWEDDEWEEEEEWKESLTERVLALVPVPQLVGFAVDVATIAIPAMLMLLVIVLFQKTTFEIFETAMLVGGATLITMFVSDAKQKLLQRLKQPKF